MSTNSMKSFMNAMFVSCMLLLICHCNIPTHAFMSYRYPTTTTRSNYLLKSSSLSSLFLPSPYAKSTVLLMAAEPNPETLFLNNNPSKNHDNHHDRTDDPILFQFVNHVQDSIYQNTFLGLTLHGMKKPKVKNNANESIRGCIKKIYGRLVQVQSDQLYLQLTVKYHGATDICKNFPVDDETMIVKNLLQLFQNPSAVVTSEWGVQSQSIQSAELQTTNWKYELQSTKKSFKLKRRKVTPAPSNDNKNDMMTIPKNDYLLHDRQKQVPISNQSPFLQVLGVVDENGRPRPGKKAKYRQCQKFVEIVSNLIRRAEQQQRQQEQIKQTNDNNNDDIKMSTNITITDMGCGRGYLTFALHSYLMNHFQSVQTKGIDVRPKLVQEITTIARSLGPTFDTLSFEDGTIEDVLRATSLNKVTQAASSLSSSSSSSSSSLDVLIALHACDTATDDALWYGIHKQADIIVVAPCCHKELRPQIDYFFANNKDNANNDHPLSDIMRHGVYRERLSETVTDSLRALLLEYAGYKVQVFEFIGGEHTSKNVMITAVKDINSKANKNDIIQDRIDKLIKFHGIQYQRLAQWMSVDLLGGENHKKTLSLSAKHGLPPLN